MSNNIRKQDRQRDFNAHEEVIRFRKAVRSRGDNVTFHDDLRHFALE